MHHAETRMHRMPQPSAIVGRKRAQKAGESGGFDEKMLGIPLARFRSTCNDELYPLTCV
jgi:hypothetical protein